MPARYITLSRDVKIQPRMGIGFLAGVMTYAVRRVAEVAPPLIEDTLVLTSVRDGVHSSRSLHYADLAFDIQWAGEILGSIIAAGPNARREEAERWSHRIRQALGRGWDIVLEDTHIHIERDRLKGGGNE